MAERDSVGLTPQDNRKFALVVGGAFLVLAGLAWWRGHSIAFYATSCAGGLLLIAGLLIPERLGPLHRGWMRMAELISRVTTPIILGLMYFLVVTPTGLVMRILGYNPIRRKPQENSYWINSEDRPDTDLRRQF